MKRKTKDKIMLCLMSSMFIFVGYALTWLMIETFVGIENYAMTIGAFVAATVTLAFLWKISFRLAFMECD